MSPKLTRLTVALVAVGGMILSACATVSGTTTSTQTYKIGNFADGVAAELSNWNSMPPGSNVSGCKPSSSHPYPVVLVHGTFANAAFSWQELSPMLADDGYCVEAFNYGQVPALAGTPIMGTAEISASAQQLSSFVDKVLSETGAKKVDIIGHSQGGMMPRYYIQDLGGASKVNMMIGLAASNEGTTAMGLGTLAQKLSTATNGALSMANVLQCPACDEQVQGSAFITALDSQSGGGTSPGVKYVNIESKYDEIVTPYTNAFLPAASNVQNLTVQDYCSTDYTEHIGIIYDPVTLDLVANALGADSPSYKPPCVVVLPVVS